MSKSLILVSLRSVSNGALRAEKLPDRIKILDWGESHSVKGPVKLSDLSASRLPARQKETGFEKIALDFEHNTVPGSPEYERSHEPRKVAAYGIPRVVTGEGLFLENLEWTPAGKAEALNYADLSPAVEFDDQGNISFVHSVALTRNGAVEGLSFFSTTLPSQNPMNEIKPDQILTVAEIAPVFGLAATASKADVLGKLCVLAALSAIIIVKDNKIVALAAAEVKDGKLILIDPALDARVKKIEDAGNKQIATLSATLDGKVITLTAEDLAKFGGRIEKLETTITATNSAVTEKERNELIARFSADGKVPLNADGQAYSVEDLKKLDLPMLKVLHANTPATVPLTARGRKHTADNKSTEGLTGLQKAIAANKAEVGH